MDKRIYYVLRIADACLIHGQRLGEWCGHAPIVEEDIALTNVALDHIGQARALLTLAGELEGRGRDEDALAFLRQEREYRNPTALELPNGDFARTVLRVFLWASFMKVLCTALSTSTNAQLSAIAAKSLKEVRYHLRHARDWLVRLGDGTAESQRRAQAALDWLLPFTDEFWTASGHEAQARDNATGVDVAALRADWDALVNDAIAEATLTRPAAVQGYISQGKQGLHSEHLGYVLAEMQSLARAHPGATW